MCLMTPACIKVEFLSHWFGWYKFHHENSPNRQKHRAKNSYNCLDSFHHFWLKSWAKIDVNELWKWPCFMNQQSCINLSFALLCLWYELWKILGAVCVFSFFVGFLFLFFFFYSMLSEKSVFLKYLLISPLSLISFYVAFTSGHSETYSSAIDDFFLILVYRFNKKLKKLSAVDALVWQNVYGHITWLS